MKKESLQKVFRGDGEVGEDILENLKTIEEISKTINSNTVPSLLGKM